MAKLRNYTVNYKAIESGEWIEPGDEFDDLSLKVRGYTDQYYDAQNRRLRRAAHSVGGDITKVPNAVQRSIRVECLIEFVALDVRNLEDDNGQPVTFVAFCDRLRRPEHNDLVVAVMRAAAMVGRGLGTDAEDAAGN